MEDIFTIQLTVPELRYLCSLLGLPGLDGEDERQTENLSASEKSTRSAQASLAARHYLRPPAAVGGTVALDQTVAALLTVAALPQQGLTARVLHGNAVETEDLQLLVAGELLVEVRQGATSAYSLTVCRTREVAIERVIDFVGLKKQPAAHEGGFHIAAADMGQASYIIAGNGLEDGATFLQGKGVPDKAAVQFAAALANPVRQCLIEAVAWEGGQPRLMNRLTLVEGAYGLWMAGPLEQGDDLLEVTPVTATAAAARLHQITQRVLSPQQANLRHQEA